MMAKRDAVEILVGFAAGPNGSGLVYATARSSETQAVQLRVPFSVRRSAGTDGREVAYAAVTALCKALRSRGGRAIQLRFGDAAIAAELRGDGTRHPALAMAYVSMRCAMNALGVVSVESAPAEAVADLEVRARAETAFEMAA